MTGRQRTIRPRDASGAPAPEALPPARWLLPVALAGTLAAIALRVYAVAAAGALWRDEAGSAATATASSFADFLARQQYDSFPLLWQLLLRVWTSLGGDGDASIRALGLVVALLLVPALWWTSRALAVVPLASLLFAGVAPTFVVWAGIQNRAYGFGAVLLAVLIGAVWRLAQQASTGRIVLAAVVALLAVHTTYHLPVMLAALLGGAALVGLRRRDWRVVLASGGVGIVAAASLLVYSGVLERSRALAKVVYAPISLGGVLQGVYGALAPGGAFVAVAFVVLALAACVWGWIVMARGADAPPLPSRDDDVEAVVFAATSATLALVGQTVFLLYLSFLTQPWYYSTVLLVVAVAIDVVLQRGVALVRLRDAIAAVVAVLLVLSTVLATPSVGRRLSNLDLVAAYLKENARPEDLIVVYPWHYGLSFSRYYDGATPWMTIPAVSGHEYHRFDQLEELMRKPELIKPGFQRIYQTLERRNDVWVVGRPATEVTPQFPPPPIPRDDDPTSWRDGLYTAIAGLQLSWILNKSTARALPVPPLTDAPVSDYEDAPLTQFTVKPR